MNIIHYNEILLNSEQLIFKGNLSVNVWGGELDDIPVGPHIIDHKLNDKIFHDFLRKFVAKSS